MTTLLLIGTCVFIVYVFIAHLKNTQDSQKPDTLETLRERLGNSPDDPELHAKMAFVLLPVAEQASSTTECEELVNTAIRHFEQSRQLDSRDNTPLLNWALALGYATTEFPETARGRYLNQARQTFKKFLANEPENTDADFLWSEMLAEVTPAFPQKDQPALLEEICATLARQGMEERDAEDLYLWGATLADLADISSAQDKIALLEKSMRVFSAISEEEWEDFDTTARDNALEQLASALQKKSEKWTARTTPDEASEEPIITLEQVVAPAADTSHGWQELQPPHTPDSEENIAAKPGAEALSATESAPPKAPAQIHPQDVPALSLAAMLEANRPWYAAFYDKPQPGADASYSNTVYALPAMGALPGLKTTAAFTPYSTAIAPVRGRAGSPSPFPQPVSFDEMLMRFRTPLEQEKRVS